MYTVRVSSGAEAHRCLAETLLLVTPRSVRQESSVLALHRDVVLERDIADFDVIEGPGAQIQQLGRAISHQQLGNDENRFKYHEVTLNGLQNEDSCA